MKCDIDEKEKEGQLYENGSGKKIIGPSKLKLWVFFWGQGECERHLVYYYRVCDTWSRSP